MSNVLSLSEDNNYEGTDSNSNFEDEDHSHSVTVFIETCNSQAFAHVLYPTAQENNAMEVSDATEAMGRRYNCSIYRGLLIDSGCSFISTSGLAQYIEHCREHVVQPEVDIIKNMAINFENKRHTSPCTARIRVPVQKRWLECDLHLIRLYLPLIMSVRDVSRIRVYLDNIFIEVINKAMCGDAIFTRK